MHKGKEIEELLSRIDYLERKVKSLETKLSHSRKKAEELRVVLLSDFSFKLRTPLNLIVGFSNLLSDENINQQKRDEYIERINTGTEELLRLFSRLAEITG